MPEYTVRRQGRPVGHFTTMWTWNVYRGHDLISEHTFKSDAEEAARKLNR